MRFAFYIGFLLGYYSAQSKQDDGVYCEGQEYGKR